MSKYNFTNNNTITIPQYDYKGQNRMFNYQTGYKFIPFQTTMMIADATTLAGGALSGDGFLYVGCSDTISMKDLETICAMSDIDALTKQLSKLSQRKARKLQAKYQKSYADTYNIAMNTFIEWCVDTGMTDALMKNFMKEVPKTDNDGNPLDRDSYKMITEMFFAMGTKHEHQVQPDTFMVSTLNPVRNFEEMTDAKLLFFLDNIKGKMPHLLCVVYSEKENYYGLDDIPYYEFSYLPNAITSVFHPSQIGEVPMWLSHLRQSLQGTLLKVDSKKKGKNGLDIQVVMEVLDYCNGYVHLVANHQDDQYQGITIKTEKGDITAPKNQYRWWVPVDDVMKQGSSIGLMTGGFGSKPMDVAFLGGMARDEMMRSSSILCALLPCGKDKTSSRQDLWSGGKEMKAEIRK